MRTVIAIACVVSLVSATPAMAKKDLDLEQEMEQAGEALKESLTTLMNLIQKAVQGVPQYEAPEIMDNGDIIIRRKQPEDETKDERVET